MDAERRERGDQRHDGETRRCSWAKTPEMIAYHDEEWGLPLHGDSSLFELLTLEGAQAGLSWETVLRKRARYREVFDGFVPERVARFTRARVERILRDPGVVRNRAKIESTVSNARALLKVRDEFGSFDAYVWSFVDGTPIVNRRTNSGRIPAFSAGVGGDERRSAPPRLSLRRSDDLLCVHAGFRHGQRPSRRLRVARARREAGQGRRDEAPLGKVTKAVMKTRLSSA